MKMRALMVVPLLLCSAAPLVAPQADELDRILAEHPDVGRQYVKSFNAGIRVPPRFRGEWSSDRSTCGSDGDDMDTRIWVDAVTVGYGHATYVITRIEPDGTRTIKLTYGPFVEGYHYTVPPPSLTLSADGKALLGPKGEGRWRRCTDARN
jgi:hypothetical protein